MSVSDFFAAEKPAFDRQRDIADYGYQNALVRNSGQRQSLNVERLDATRRLGKQLTARRQQIPGQFTGRGLLKSGIYGKALGDFETARLQAESGLARGFQKRGMDLSQQLSSAEMNRLIQLADVDLNEAQRRTAIAGMLQGATS